MNAKLLAVIGFSALLCIVMGCDSNPTGSPEGTDEGSAIFRGAVPGDSIVDIKIETGRIESWGGVGHFSVVIQDIPWRLEGFDLLLSYDDSIYRIWSVDRGSLFDCGWEYFTYRTGEQAGTSCPERAATGLLRVVGIAETNNGPYHPDFGCVDDLPFAFRLFTVALQPAVDDHPVWAPVQFYWCDCGDNSLAFWPGEPYGSRQAVSRYVVDYDTTGRRRLIQNDAAGFPTVAGAQHACFGGGYPGSEPERAVDFVSASIITGYEPGDLNLNSYINEISDVVLFSNWLVDGHSVFTRHLATQLAVTDANRDGIPCTLADFQYMVRIIVGDALPYARLEPDTTTVRVYSDGEVSLADSMGSVRLVVEGEVTPELLADQMDIKWNYDGGDTHLLVYSMNHQRMSGGFVRLANATIKSIELATYEGAPVQVNLEYIGMTH